MSDRDTRVRSTDMIGTPDTTETSGETVSEQVEKNVPGLDPDNETRDGDVRVDLSEVGVGADIHGNSPDVDGESDEDGDRPSGNATTDEWIDYRLGHGYTDDEIEGMGRDELRDLDDR